jgi:hypothetical protein
VSQRAYSGDDIYKQSFKPNLLSDSLIAKITTSSGTVYSINVVYGITAGITGADGANGPKTLTHFVYFQTSSASAPATPSATSYTFSTNSFSGLTSGWATTPPTFAAGNTNKYWYSYFTAEENTAGGDTASGGNLNFSASVQGIGFSGLVTFTGTSSIDDGSGNSLSFGSSGTTTIDGGNIITGTLTADKINTSSITLNSFTNDSGFVDSSGAAAAAPVQSVAGLTGTVTTANLSSAGLYLTSNPSGFVNTSQAAAAAPVQSVNGATGTVSLTAAGLNITTSHVSGLSDAATVSVASIRQGTTADNVGLGSVTNATPAGQLTGAFSAVTSVTAGNIFIGAANTSTINYIELNAANANIIIADNT